MRKGAHLNPPYTHVYQTIPKICTKILRVNKNIRKLLGLANGRTSIITQPEDMSSNATKTNK